MIHFHHQTTFQVLPSLAILSHSETKEISFTDTTGRWRAHSYWNSSINTDNTIQHFVFLPLFGSAFHCDSVLSWTQKLVVFNLFFARKILSSIYHVLGSCDRASWNVGWREINQQDATNPMFIIKLLSQHISGIIMPIIRRTRPCITAYGVLHWFCWLWLCGAGS
jgi:hypothetical protein